MSVQQLRAAGAKDRSENESDEDRVVELPGDRDEVGDEVNRRREVANQRAEQQLAAAWDTVVGEQAPKENDAVGDEPGEGACVLAPTGGDERGDACRVGRQRQARTRSETTATR